MQSQRGVIPFPSGGPERFAWTRFVVEFFVELPAQKFRRFAAGQTRQRRGDGKMETDEMRERIARQPEGHADFIRWGEATDPAMRDGDASTLRSSATAEDARPTIYAENQWPARTDADLAKNDSEAELFQ